MKIIDLETAKGTEILGQLLQEGWKLARQYSPLAFDKGIDFDSYVLRRDGDELVFEWTNWFEWQIEGSSEIIRELSARFSLPIEES